MKTVYAFTLCFLLCLMLCAGVQGEGLTIIPAPEATYVPFAAETGEQAVNVREAAGMGSARVGRLERGAQLTVTGETTDDTDVIWYEVMLADGTIGYIRSDLLMTAEVAEAERAAVPEAQGEQLIGNWKTKKYHEPWCKSLPKESNRAYFDTADEAEAKGYVHCKNCD